MNKRIQIRKRNIGEDQPLFIVAECGVTCNYDLNIAKELIDVVREANADAIKFIFWFPDEIMSDSTILYEYDTLDGRKSTNMYQMLKSLRFSFDDWRILKAYADEKDVILFSTVNSPSGIKYAEALGLEAYKLSSWDFNYIPLWRQIAEIGKPMIIDTGPVNSYEVSKVLQIMKDAGNNESILVHCYHTKNPKEINMRAISYMQYAFNSLVGFSAIDYHDEQDIVAVALGAVFLEKRLTLSRNLPGHHHVLSKEPKEFKEYVHMIRETRDSLGIFDLRPSLSDLAERKRWFRHIVANQDIPAGTILTTDMLTSKRPEAGVSPEYLDFFIGRAIKRKVKYNESLSMDDV